MAEIDYLLTRLARRDARAAAPMLKSLTTATAKRS